MRKSMGMILCAMGALAAGVAIAATADPGATGAKYAPAVNVGAEPAANDAEAAWDNLADEFFGEVYFKFGPTQATQAGFHQLDSQLEDYSRAGIEANIAALHKFEKRVEAFEAKGLSETRAADRETVLSTIRAASC